MHMKVNRLLHMYVRKLLYRQQSILSISRNNTMHVHGYFQTWSHICMDITIYK